MTPKEREQEWNVEFQTRLGNLCGNRVPTREQTELAEREAKEHVDSCDLQESLDKWKERG